MTYVVMVLLAVYAALVADTRGRGRLTVAHLSGKFSAEVDHLLAELDGLLEEHNADVITLTEVSLRKWRRALAGWAEAHGWSIWHPDGDGANECAILSSLPFNKTRAVRLSALRLKVGRVHPTYLVEARIKGWGWFSVLHTPAHTAGLRRGLWPTRVYHSVLDGVRIVAAKPRRRWTLLGDLNVDIRRAVMRKLWRWATRGGTIVNPVDQGPTEGRRAIDGGTVRGLRVARPAERVKTESKDVDHDAIVFEVENYRRFIRDAA